MFSFVDSPTRASPSACLPAYRRCFRRSSSSRESRHPPRFLGVGLANRYLSHIQPRRRARGGGGGGLVDELVQVATLAQLGVLLPLFSRGAELAAATGWRSAPPWCCMGWCPWPGCSYAGSPWRGARCGANGGDGERPFMRSNRGNFVKSIRHSTLVQKCCRFNRRPVPPCLPHLWYGIPSPRTQVSLASSMLRNLRASPTYVSPRTCSACSRD